MTYLADEFPASISIEQRNTALDVLGIPAHLHSRVLRVTIESRRVVATVMRLSADGRPVVVSSTSGREIGRFIVDIAVEREVPS